MSEAVNLVGNPVARSIYRQVQKQSRCQTDLIKQLEPTAKQTVAKYLGEMELMGILTATWSKGDDGRWRRCYSLGTTEWSRLFDEVIALEDRRKEA